VEWARAAGAGEGRGARPHEASPWVGGRALGRAGMGVRGRSPAMRQGRAKQHGEGRPSRVHAGQHSLASMTVRMRVVTAGSPGSGEPFVRERL
jgi:hypothetical protein